jgi:hypothetical protein
MREEHRFAEILRLQQLPLRMTEGRRTRKETGKRLGLFASLWDDTKTSTQRQYKGYSE